MWFIYLFHVILCYPNDLEIKRCKRWICFSLMFPYDSWFLIWMVLFHKSKKINNCFQRFEAVSSFFCMINKVMNSYRLTLNLIQKFVINIRIFLIFLDRTEYLYRLIVSFCFDKVSKLDVFVLSRKSDNFLISIKVDSWCCLF